MEIRRPPSDPLSRDHSHRNRPDAKNAKISEDGGGDPGGFSWSCWHDEIRPLEVL